MSITLDKKINFWTINKSIILDVANFDAIKFAQWLRETRENIRPKLSGTALAEKAGLSKQYISLLEKGDDHSLTNKPVQPALDKVERIAKILDVDVNFAREMAGYEPITNQAVNKPVTNVMEFFEILESHGMEVQFDGGIKMLESLGEEDLQDLLDGIITNATLKAKRKNKTV